MSHSTLPVQPIPIAVAPAATAAQPVSAEEAAALASRMRVEARLPGVIVVGTTLGLVCGVVTMWPIVRGDEFLVRSMMSFHRSKLLGWMSLLAPLALVGLLLLLAFYSVRLHVQSGASTFAAVEDNLRKIRRVLAGCMLAALGAIASAISMPRGDTSGVVVLGLYAVCCVACGVLVGGVRKGLGEFESREERQRRKVIRGFAVEMRAGGSAPLARTATTTAAPLPVLPVPAQRIEVPPTEEDGPSVAGAGSAPAGRVLPPSLPVSAAPVVAQPVAPVAALPVADADMAGTQGERDLRTMLHLMAAIGIGIYILQSPVLLRMLGEWDVLLNARALPTAWGGGRGRGGAGGAFNVLLYAFLAQMLLAACGVAWIAWGVVVLSFGARLRLATLVLAWVTFAAVLAYIAAAVAGEGQSTRGFSVQVDTRAVIVTALNPHLPELIHAVTMLVLLTRPRVKDLFTAGSEAGEGE